MGCPLAAHTIRQIEIGCYVLPLLYILTCLFIYFYIPFLDTFTYVFYMCTFVLCSQRSLTHRTKYAQPSRLAIKLCLQREIILLGRMKPFVVIRWAQLALLGVITGTVFLQLDTTSISAANSMLGVLYYSLIMMYDFCCFSLFYFPVQRFLLFFAFFCFFCCFCLFLFSFFLLFFCCFFAVFAVFCCFCCLCHVTL